MSITITGLSKLYGKFKALSEIDLNIRTGQSVGLVGLNGAGETTLLKTIVGLIVNFDGEVLINNQAVNDRDAKSNISFLPEVFAVFFMSYRTDSDGRLIFGYLDESQDKFPDDWKLPWQASYVAKMRFKDNDVAYHYALKAAKAPYAPPIVRVLPAILERNLGNIETAYTYLTTLLDYSIDSKEIEAINEELKKLDKKVSPK